MAPSNGETIQLCILLIFFTITVQSASAEEVSSERLVGWQPTLDRRGALGILESCLFTTVACTWSIQKLNVPAAMDSDSTKLRRKILHALMTVFLPEIVLAHAIMERAAAIESLRI
jgi:hypothetical protein